MGQLDTMEINDTVNTFYLSRFFSHSFPTNIETCIILFSFPAFDLAAFHTMSTSVKSPQYSCLPLLPSVTGSLVPHPSSPAPKALLHLPYLVSRLRQAHARPIRIPHRRLVDSI